MMTPLFENLKFNETVKKCECLTFRCHLQPSVPHITFMFCWRLSRGCFGERNGQNVKIWIFGAPLSLWDGRHGPTGVQNTSTQCAWTHPYHALRPLNGPQCVCSFSFDHICLCHCWSVYISSSLWAGVSKVKSLWSYSPNIVAFVHVFDFLFFGPYLLIIQMKCLLGRS